MKNDIINKAQTQVLDFPVYNQGLEQLDFSKKTLINTINQYSYIVTKKDDAFKKALAESDVLLPDGIGITLASKFLTGRSIQKIAGADVHKHLLEKLDREKGSCFYLGASESTLDKIKERVNKEYPGIRVGSYSPPFKKEFAEADNNRMIEMVNRFSPDVLFVGMTAPKQEKWAHAHKASLDANIICSIGAVFDFYAGTVKRPHPFWINMGMEWFIRLFNEPKRMWKRYLYYGPLFAYILVNRKFQQISK